MVVAVVGAGPCGLLSGKYLSDHGYNYVIFEQAGTLGGSWVYSDHVGVDKFGVESTCMYEDLITNVPKELMTFPGFPFPENKIDSYISQAEVLKYYASFADAFHLEKYIKYYTRVMQIIPYNDKWVITTQNLQTKCISSSTYDYVLVCNGRFSKPFIPKIPGDHLFNGVKMHSRDFKKLDKRFQEKRVLIIGGRRSGVDLASRIVTVAEHLYLSSRESNNIEEHKNLTIKSEVLQIKETEVIFEDNTVEQVDTILYCTGYLYVCPFIGQDCGIKLENNGVTPLYKRIVNVQYPTMFFIGIPFLITGIPLYDVQVRFAVAAINKNFSIPSTEEMLKECDEFILSKESSGVPKRHYFRIPNSEEASEYCRDLSEMAKIPTVPPVVYDLFNKSVSDGNKACYKIIDDNTFVRIDFPL